MQIINVLAPKSYEHDNDITHSDPLVTVSNSCLLVMTGISDHNPSQTSGLEFFLAKKTSRSIFQAQNRKEDYVRSGSEFSMLRMEPPIV